MKKKENIMKKDDNIKIYRLLIIYNKIAFCKNECRFKKSELYFVGDIGLETAKKYFSMARNNEDKYFIKIDLCDIDHDGEIIAIENIETFVRK